MVDQKVLGCQMCDHTDWDWALEGKCSSQKLSQLHSGKFGNSKCSELVSGARDLYFFQIDKPFIGISTVNTAFSWFLHPATIVSVWKLGSFVKSLSKFRYILPCPAIHIVLRPDVVTWRIIN